VRGCEEEGTDANIDKLRSKKNREVARSAGAEDVGGTQQPSAVGVLRSQEIVDHSWRASYQEPYTPPPTALPSDFNGFNMPAGALPTNPLAEALVLPEEVAKEAVKIPAVLDYLTKQDESSASADFPKKINSPKDVATAVAKMSASKKMPSCPECGSVRGVHAKGCKKGK
jgi:hypothetical protein